MLLKIDSAWLEYSQCMLILLCCAKRPLTAPELVDAIAVELGDLPKFNPDRRLEGVDAIYEVCPGFIEVDEQPFGEAPLVRIAHFSVQEYLESERILQHKVAKFSIKKRKAHTDIACICLTYLLSMSVDPKEEYPLALYAAKTWHEHLRDGDKSIYLVQHQTLQLFQNTTDFENWVSIWNIDDYSGKKPAGKIPSSIYYASRLGLDLVLSKLFSGSVASSSSSGLSLAEVSTDINAQGGWYGNALQAASAQGHEAIVRQLLDKGADINAQGGRYGNALQAALARGQRSHRVAAARQ